MGVRFKVKVDGKQIENIIAADLLKQINIKLPRVIKSVNKRMQDVMSLALYQHPTVKSLIAGKLRSEFGLADPKTSIIPILEEIVKSVKIEINDLKLQNTSIVGKFQIVGILIGDLLSSPASSYVSEPSGSKINWLDWILRKGQKIILRNYVIRFKPSPKSRTGDALTTKWTRHNYRVSPEFAGVPNKNFITETIKSVEEKIESIVIEEFSRIL